MQCNVCDTCAYYVSLNKIQHIFKSNGALLMKQLSSDLDSFALCDRSQNSSMGKERKATFQPGHGRIKQGPKGLRTFIGMCIPASRWRVHAPYAHR